jgi:endogenous inhibitor of DNA gyrase (YacG/DUF329 family)
VNQNDFKMSQISWSGLGFWLAVIAVLWLLGSAGIWFLVKSFLMLLGFLFIAPIVGFLILRWWLQRNLVEGPCPTCGYQVVGVNSMTLRCPNCSEPLKVEKGNIRRLTPPGTVDVDAVEVPTKQLDE